MAPTPTHAALATVDAGRPQPAVHASGLEPLRSESIPPRAPYLPERSAFAVLVGGVLVDQRVFLATALPNESVEIIIEGPAASGAHLIYASGAVTTDGPGRWTWTAPPEPGVTALRIVDAGMTEAIHLNVFVMHPWAEVQRGRLNGYRLGIYPRRPLRDDPAYDRPRGFIAAGPGDEDILVAPHFTLGQFVCRQAGAPRYLVLRAPLLVKLEAVLERLNQSGIAASTLKVLSGYRTPAYNAALGNETEYSRHCYGDAADVFVDRDDNRRMDDLNGDGRSNFRDAAVIRGLVESLEQSAGAEVEVGGLGTYAATHRHGAFVHIDARGTRARWVAVGP